MKKKPVKKLGMMTGNVSGRLAKVHKHHTRVSNYLSEIEYAVTENFRSLWVQYEEANNVEQEIEKLDVVAQDNYNRAYFMQKNAESSEDLMDGVGLYWDTYFGADKEHYYKSKNLDSLKIELAEKQHSYSLLASSLLSFAKQLLSKMHGNPENWPLGRDIGSQKLTTIIQQARNQSQHWEEGRLRAPVTECFTRLFQDFGSPFDKYHEKNLAFEVVKVLDWKSYNDFQRDMSILK